MYDSNIWYNEIDIKSLWVDSKYVNLLELIFGLGLVSLEEIIFTIQIATITLSGVFHWSRIAFSGEPTTVILLIRFGYD